MLKSLRLWLSPGEQERPALLDGQLSSSPDEIPQQEQASD
jgi:hypothetical protein